MPSPPPTFEDLWIQVDSLEVKRLPQNALSIVEEIKNLARKSEKWPDYIKALLYVNKLKKEPQAWDLAKSIHEIEQDLKGLPLPTSAIVQSYLGELYRSYLQQNYWRLQDQVDGDTTIISEMSIGQLQKRANDLFEASISSGDLRHVPWKEYELLWLDEAQLRPGWNSLDAVLAHRALKHLSASDPAYQPPFTDMVLVDPAFLGEVSTFMAAKLPHTKFRGPIYRTVQHFQSKLSDLDLPIELRIEFDLMRLRFVLENSIIADKDSLYRSTLHSIIETHRQIPTVTIAYADLADYWLRQDPKLVPSSRSKAYQLCREGEDLHPKSAGAEICASRINQILAKHLSVQAEEVVLPNEPSLVSVKYQNVSEIFVRVTALSAEEKILFEEIEHENRLAWLRDRRVVQQLTYTLQLPEDYNMHSTEIPVAELPVGYYMCLVSTDPDFTDEGQAVATTPFFVSNFAYHHIQESGNGHVYVVDRSNGQPIVGVEAQWLVRKYEQRLRKHTLTTHLTNYSDASGRLSIPKKARQSYQLILSHGNDWLATDDYLYDYGRSDRNRPRRESRFYTDRAIYRPGQKVYFKAITMRYEPSGNPVVEQNQAIKVSLYDANGQEIDELSLISNEFGSVSGAFLLPIDGLTGQFALGADNQRHTIQVEAYKRPNFEILLEEPRESHILGDTITVKGTVMSYAGVPLRQARATFQVTRKMQWMYRGWFYSRSYFPTSHPRQIAAGQILTDDQGKFSYTFVAQADHQIEKKFAPKFLFEQEVSVTDVSGETQYGTLSIPLSHQPFNLSLTIQDQYPVGKLDSMSIGVFNANSQPISVQGQVDIAQLSPADYQRKRYWEFPDLPLITQAEYQSRFPEYASTSMSSDAWPTIKSHPSITFAGEGSMSIKTPTLSALPAGRFRLSVIITDPEGNTLRRSFVIELVDPQNRYRNANALLTQLVEQRTYQPGDTCKIMVNAYSEKIMYALHRKQSVPEIVWLDLNGGWEHISIPIRESDRGGLKIEWVAASRNRAEIKSFDISVPWSNKELDVYFSSFRDLVKPGDEEEITIVIDSPNEVAHRSGELMVTMFDAALESFREHHWNNTFYHKTYFPSLVRSISFGLSSGATFSKNWWPRSRFVSLIYPDLNLFGVHQPFYSTRRFRSAEAAVMEDGIEASTMTSLETSESKQQVKDQVDDGAQKDPRVRENFAETTFFYPDIQIDSGGRVKLQFIVGDALTTWKIKALAHQKDLTSGQAEIEIISRKELMLTPNSPRFLRAGDQMVISAKLDNLSELPVDAEIALTLRALGDDRVLNHFLQSPASQSITLAASASMPLHWPIQLPDDFHEPLVYEISAVSARHTDAFRMSIPILSNRELVTESKVLQTPGASRKAFSFDPLKSNNSNTLTSERYIIEYTSNPIWYAIKALPYLMEYPHECTEQIFNRYAANVIGAHLVDKHPVIRKAIQSWKENDLLQGELDLRSDLKSISLHETPWVLDALSEQQQQQRLTLFFDENNLNHQLVNSLRKLEQYQGSDGGFPWFPGGRSNWYITQYILEGFGKIKAKEQPLPNQMIDQALKFTHREAFQWHERILKQQTNKRKTEDEVNLNPLVIQYAYALSFYPNHDLPKEQAPILQMIKREMRMHWNKMNLLEQAMIGLVALRDGDHDLMASILKSLKERAVMSNDLGMYWQVQRGWRWSELPIATHTLIMHLFFEANEEMHLQEAMKVWLLNQKRTQHWPTTKATAEAVDALLLTGSAWIDAKPVTITVDDEVIEDSDIGSAEMYLKKDFVGEQIGKDLADITVENPNQGISWGAVYWQYFEDLDKIKSSDSAAPLRLQKALFVESIDDGRVMQRPLDQEAVSPGDKIIVKLKITADRPMEFIHLKDYRAGGLEPVKTISQYIYRGGLGYYQSTLDQATHFFIDYLPSGVHHLQYELTATQLGIFSNGISRMQSMYAPEFGAHTDGQIVVVRAQG